MPLPLKTVERILRNAGARRVSKEATIAFSKYIEILTKDISSEAWELARHAGRKTVTEKDIQMLRKRMRV